MATPLCRLVTGDSWDPDGAVDQLVLSLGLPVQGISIHVVPQAAWSVPTANAGAYAFDRGNSSHAVSQAALPAPSANTGLYPFEFDAKKLTSTDKSAVSKGFLLRFGTMSVLFKIVINAKVTKSAKGGGHFKNAKGVGMISLKCDGDCHDVPEARMDYCVYIGSGIPGDTQPLRGPVCHDFAEQGSVSGLPQGSDVEWNFSEVVDRETQKFVVYLEIM